jgi:predicted transcriptional regulator
MTLDLSKTPLQIRCRVFMALLNMSRVDVAEILGCTPESVSYAIGDGPRGKLVRNQMDSVLSERLRESGILSPEATP